MSEYDHMMRGGKTGSGPMADHIQVRGLSSIARIGDSSCFRRAHVAYGSLQCVTCSRSPTLIDESVSESAPFSLLAASVVTRTRRLAMETIDLSKDEFFMRNHLGQMECKLCLTLHPTEGCPIFMHARRNFACELMRPRFTTPQVPILPTLKANATRKT
jgi:hypothetical protein